MSYLTDEQLQAEVAAVRNQAVADLTDLDVARIATANTRARNIIRAALLSRGFSASQVDNWDRGAEFHRDLGIYWSMALAGEVEKVKHYDRSEELTGVAVFVSDTLQLPTGQAGSISGGNLTATTARFTRDTKF